MHVEDEIRFDGTIPTPDSILEEVKKISGISDIVWKDARKTKFTHPDFTKRGFFMYKKENSIFIGRGWTDQWYLLDLTIVALMNLGGKYNGKVSEFGNRKWSEVRGPKMIL